MSDTEALPKRTGFALRQFDVFKKLSVQRVDEIANQSRWSSVGAGTLLPACTSGKPEVVLIVSGSARISAYAAGGKEVTVRCAGPGDFFGYQNGDLGADNHIEAITQEPTVVARLYRDEFMQLVRSEPDLAEHLVLRLLSSMYALVDRVVDLSTLAVSQRLQVELLRMAHQAGGGPEVRLSPAPRHADLASRIGTNREQVTREINQLIRDGVLSKDKDRKSLVIRDVRVLERMVGAYRSHG